MNPFVRDNLRFVLSGKKILLGITGSIAAFKACDIVRFLRDCGAQVRVVLSSGAENFVTKTTLENLSGYPVLSGFWESAGSELRQGTHHIDTARWADLILVAPATAHFIGKVANGLADDLLTTEILAFRGPLLLAPAMNPAMFEHPAVQENLARLINRGVRILGPTHGFTSCGEEGLGRMIEPEEIVERVSYAFHPHQKGKAIITLGPTRSAIDPVRYISNRSSGLMGASLCWAAFQSGYEVVAICGPAKIDLPREIQIIRVQTALEMANAASEHWKQTDLFIGTAAVLDWDVKNPSSSKLKKEDGPPSIALEKNSDILAFMSERKAQGQFVVGFAAETSDPLNYGKKKLERKGCDAIFINDVSKSGEGFESEMNGGWWVTLKNLDSPIVIPTCQKSQLARKILNLIYERR